MSRILTLNLDFVLILQAGLLLLLTTACPGLCRTDSGKGWSWFGWYAFLQVIRTGLQLAVFEGGGNVTLFFLNDLLLAGSTLLLIEFARRSRQPTATRWVHFPVAAAMVFGWLVDHGQFAVWIAFPSAMLGGMWAASAFWRGLGQPRPQVENNILRQIGLILIGCHLLSSIPDHSLQEGMNVLSATLPPIAVRCTFFLLLTLSFLRWLQARPSAAHPAELTASRQRRRIMCGTGIMGIGLAGCIGADFAGRQQDHSMRQQILARTQIAAASISAEEVGQLNWDERDLTNPHYLKLKAQMIAMRQANADLKFVLLAGMREQKAFFLVDSEKPESADYSPPGQSYDEATADYLAGLASGQSFILGPETDRWGTWMFGDTPIRDAQGRTLAYLELDIAAADWDALIHHARLPVLLINLLIIALVLGSFQALERLRESSTAIALSEQRNRSLVEGSPDCVQMFDLAGRYLAVNQNGLRALGLIQDQVLGHHFAELWPDESKPSINEAIRTTLQGQPTSFETDYLKPDGTRVTWRVATNPVYDTKGKVCNFVGICVDLTVRKQMEIALLAAKKSAEAATQAKSDFLAVMSHEIRTPLAGVLSMLDLLQQSPLEPQTRHYTRFARDSADSLMHLLNDALDSAKIEAGKLTLEIIPFRPHDYFETMFESATIRAATKNLTFRHEVGPSLPAVLLGDPTRLRQVINNLVNNALKFTPKGSVTCTLSAEPIDLGSVLLKITVSDTGIGISEDARARLFTKYAQAEADTNRHYGGTGLGLSIVKSLAELMRGEITVTSTLGQGATFTFTGGFKIGTEASLPPPMVALAQTIAVTPIPNLPVTAPPPRKSPTQQLRILVVDDDISNRTVTESLVTFIGHHHIAFANNGRAAVDQLIKENFDVVLMDNRMPVMDGFMATTLIRDPATGTTNPSVYIIALTANASTEDRAKCLAHGMNDFVTKPVRFPAIDAALTRAIEHIQAHAKAASALRATPAGDVPPSTPSRFNLPPGLSASELLASFDADAVATANETTSEDAPLAPEILEKITAIFFREAPRRFATMRQAYAQNNPPAIGLEAHTLKSNARYLKAIHLSKLCAQIEKLADQGKLDDIQPLLGESEQVFAELHHQLLHPLNA